MAGDWIKVEKATARKPEILRMADQLSLHPDQVFGLCVRFWFWCDDQLTTGHAPSVTNVTLDSVIGHAGFSTALVNVGWLRVRDGSLEVPNFDRHLSDSAKNRALSGERKKKQRVGVPKMSRADRDKSVTREEKRRYVIGPDVVIPDGINKSQCIEAAGKWFDYLLSKGLDDKVPETNSPQEQAFWNTNSKMTPEEFCSAVDNSMAQGWKSLVLPKSSSAKSRKSAATSSEWVQVQKALSIYPNDWEKRNGMLGPELSEALKRTGTAKVRDANDFELKSLEPIFESNLKDIRSNGTT